MLTDQADGVRVERIVVDCVEDEVLRSQAEVNGWSNGVHPCELYFGDVVSEAAEVV